MRQNTCRLAALFVLMLSLCISNAALSEENACAHESIEQIFVRTEQITSAVKVPNQGHMLYGSIVVYDQCFYCHEQLSNEYIVDSYQEGHTAGVDGTCIYCGYLVVDHNAIRLLYTESGFSIGGTSEFILTITNTTDYIVYAGCSAHYNDGTGSGTPENMFSGDICYRSDMGTIQTETLTFQPGEQKKLSVNAKIPDTWLDTSYIDFSFSGAYADSDGESHICSAGVEFTHTDDTPASPPIVWDPDVLSLDVAAKEFAVDGNAAFEVTFANKAEYPVDCWLSVFYWQGYGNAVYNNMFGGDVSQEKAEVLDGLGTDIHGYAGTDKIVLDPEQSETLNVTAEIPSTWSEKSSICFSIGGWYTPDGSDSHFVRTEYVFGNDDIPSVPDEPPAPDDQDKFEFLEIADSHYKLQNAKSGWYLNAFTDPNSLGTYSSYDGINQIFTLKKSANIQEAYTFYCENIYKAGLTGIAASGTEMKCVDANKAGSFKLLRVNNPADPSGEYAAIAVTINDTYYAVTETNTTMGSARKVALEAYTPGNKAQMWKLAKAKGVDVITEDTPVSVNMQPATLQYALDGKFSNELTLSLKLAYPTDLIDIVPNTNGTLTIHAKKAGVAQVTVTTASGVSSDAFTVWSVPCSLSVPYIKLQPNMCHELSVISDDSAMQFEFSVEDPTIAAIEKGPNGKAVSITALGNNGTTNIIAKYVHNKIVYQMKCLVEYGISDTDDKDPDRKIGWEDWFEHWKTTFPDREDKVDEDGNVIGYIYHYWNHKTNSDVTAQSSQTICNVTCVVDYYPYCDHFKDSVTTSACNPRIIRVCF